MKSNRLFFFLTMTLGLLGCGREIEDRSQLKLQFPQVSGMASKSTALATGAFPSDRRVCFGVNILGKGITSTNSTTCEPPLGVTAGTVLEGKSLSLDVPKGDRQIQIFAYLQPLSHTGACPGIGEVIKTGTKTDLYVVADMPSVKIEGAETVVDVPVKFPGTTQNYVVSLNLPTNCSSTTAPSSGGGARISDGSQVSTSSRFILKAATNSTGSNTKMTSSRFQLSVER